jgi:hypothetical protein
MVRYPLRHRRRDAVSFMDTAEIEVSDEQTDCRKMVVGALAETVGEAREATQAMRSERFWRSARLVYRRPRIPQAV